MKCLSLYFSTFILIFFNATNNSASAQTYVLNPHKANAGSVAALPLNEKDENLWIRNFFHKIQIVNIASTYDRTKIKSASQAYLELRLDDTLADADEALDLISNQWPYAKMQSDIQEIYILKIMATDPTTQGESTPMSFSDRSDFVSSLPVKFQSVVSTYPSQKQEIVAQTFGENIDRVFVFGQETKWPLTLATGRWLIHTLTEDQLTAYWVDIPQTKTIEPKIKSLWTRSIWKSIPHSNLKTQLIATRPSHLAAAGITVIVKDENGIASPLLISSSARDIGTLKPVESIRPDNQWARDFSTEIKAESESNSILRSPWFWIIASSAAGLGGYLLYQSTQTHTVTTR